MALAVRNDTRGALAGTDGDYSPPQLNASGDVRTELSAIAGTAPDTNSGTKSAGTLRVVLATDQPALTNKLLVTPDLPSGASTAAKQPALGTAGTASADVITVQGIASMTKLLVTPDSVALPANQSVNVSQINGVTPLMGNGASGTGAQRVTIANDSTGILAGVTTVTTVSTVTNVATIGTSVTPGTAATNLGKAEDAAHSSGDVGILALGVRQDADTSPVSADGDYHAPIFDNAGNLKVNIKAGAGSGGTSIADNATFTRGTTSETVVGGVVETSAPTLTNGKAGAFSLTTGGALRVDVSSGSVPGFAEDAAAVSGDTGVMILGVRRDTAASSSGTDGDYSTLNLNSTGRLWAAANIDQINGVTPLMGNGATGTGALRVSIASDSTGVVQPGNTANTTPWLVTDTAATSGGLSFVHITSAGSNNKTQIKATAGQLYFISATNTNAAVAYLKIFNAASASVTAGTTAADMQFAIPGNAAGAGFIINIDKGIAFGTGITVMLVTGVALTNNTGVAANEVILTMGYK